MSDNRTKSVAIAALSLVVAISIVTLKPAAPREITLLTGPVGSADHEMGMNLAKSNEDIAILSFERAGAYEMLNKAISSHLIPEGVFDLARNIPSSDTVLLAITTNLVTLDSFHSATIPVLLQAVSNADRQYDILKASRSFPNADNATLPLARAAVRYYNQGQRGLSKFLPYKVTRWLNHLGFVVLPLLTILAVLLKVLVVSIKLRASVRFNGYYRRLEAIEKASANGADPLLVHQDIDLLDKDCVDFSVLRSMREQYLNLRQLIHDLRERLPGQLRNQM